MHIGGESIENFLVNMVLEKKNLKIHIYKKKTFPCFFTWEWAK